MRISFFNKVLSKYLNYKKRVNFRRLIFKSTKEKMNFGHEKYRLFLLCILIVQLCSFIEIFNKKYFIYF